MMRYRLKKKLIFIFSILAVILGGLIVYAWLHASHDTMIIIFVSSLSLAGFSWASSNFQIRGLPGTLLFFVVLASSLEAILGGYALLNPAYRASVIEKDEMKAAALVEKAATENEASRLVAETDLAVNPDDQYRSGKMLILFSYGQTAHLANIIDAPRTSYSTGCEYVQVKDRASTTSRLDEAGTIVWIQESASVVGSYNRKLLGPITADKTGKAFKFTWKVWLIDTGKHIVTAYREFEGPLPPESVEVYGDYGVPPEEDLAEWLADLPGY